MKKPKAAESCDCVGGCCKSCNAGGPCEGKKDFVGAQHPNAIDWRENLFLRQYQAFRGY